MGWGGLPREEARPVGGAKFPRGGALLGKNSRGIISPPLGALPRAAFQGWRWGRQGRGLISGGADMDTVASPQSPFPLGEAHICHCPQAAGAEGQSSAYLNRPPTWMGPVSGTLHTPGPTVTLWPGLPRPSPLAPTLGSPNSPVLPKTHPSCLPAGLGLALGLGACGMSCQRTDRVTSALPREVR